MTGDGIGRFVFRDNRRRRLQSYGPSRWEDFSPVRSCVVFSVSDPVEVTGRSLGQEGVLFTFTVPGEFHEMERGTDHGQTRSRRRGPFTPGERPSHILNLFDSIHFTIDTSYLYSSCSNGDSFPTCVYPDIPTL